jgi:hypothetical protein
MVPPAFANFFIASTSAGAALVGLLFVAISIAPENTVMGGAPIERQAVASNAFSSLLNAFFISLGALIPTSNLGWVTLVMSLVGASVVLVLGWNLLRDRQHWLNILRNMVLLLGSIIVYGYEFYYAVDLIKTPQDTEGILAITELMIVVYAIGLIRAWELLGARRFGLFGWLNPLRTVHEEIATPINEQPGQAAEANSGQQAQGHSR